MSLHLSGNFWNYGILHCPGYGLVSQVLWRTTEMRLHSLVCTLYLYICVSPGSGRGTAFTTWRYIEKQRRKQVCIKELCLVLVRGIFFLSTSEYLQMTHANKQAMFANDLKVFQEFDRLISLQAVVSTLETCRAWMHSWRRPNRVISDPGKNI